MEKDHKDEPVGVLTGGKDIMNEGSLNLSARLIWAFKTRLLC